MDYEKKYKEEVCRATQLGECCDITRENLEYIFHELKESEDDRIREELLELAKRWKEKAKGFCPEVPLWPSNEEDCDRYIAWLEKQGKETPADASYKQGWKDAIEKFCLYMEDCNGYVVNGSKCNYDSFIKFMEE